ncbi:MAG TPA: heavy metal-responsive transcriptional regulator [Egibacteraceae bacterium]|jgi:DNA-binding transcriptional MerR regulator|nr:heavy metal-responsive transcriptional regulator [Egibacteraceae bacterium]
MTRLTVSKLAERVGSTPSALRYYERIGLLPAPRRSAGGYRLYDETAEERVRFIKRAQRFGLRLDEISDLLSIRERGQCPCGHTRDLLAGRLAEIDEEMAGLARLRQDIERMVEDLPSSEDRADWACGGELVTLTRRPPDHHANTNLEA